MFRCVFVFVLGWIVAAGSAIQGPPTFFLGAWNNVAVRPGGPESFVVVYRDGKTFVTIAGVGPEREATVYVLVPPPSGSRPQPSALVVNADQRLFVIKRTDADKVVLEMFTKFSDPGSTPFYSSEPYAKGK